MSFCPLTKFLGERKLLGGLSREVGSRTCWSGCDFSVTACGSLPCFACALASAFKARQRQIFTSLAWDAFSVFLLFASALWRLTRRLICPENLLIKFCRIQQKFSRRVFNSTHAVHASDYSQSVKSLCTQFNQAKKAFWRFFHSKKRVAVERYQSRHASVCVAGAAWFVRYQYNWWWWQRRKKLLASLFIAFGLKRSIYSWRCAGV